jgi:heterotetrameric sarcosine oxidase gamma subunit
MTHESTPHLTPQAPFAGLPVVSAAGRGVIARDRDGLGLATVLARKGRAELLAQRVRERFGIELPNGPRRMSEGTVSFAGTGRGAWLAVCENGGNGFATSLRETIGDLAAISDQSDGYAVLRLAGPRVRDTLAKLVPVDIHPRAFRPGDVAGTVVADFGAPRGGVALRRHALASRRRPRRIGRVRSGGVPQPRAQLLACAG